MCGTVRRGAPAFVERSWQEVMDAEDMACVVARSPWAIQITVSANSIRTTKAFRKRSRSVGLPQLARQNRMASVL